MRDPPVDGPAGADRPAARLVDVGVAVATVVDAEQPADPGPGPVQQLHRCAPGGASPEGAGHVERDDGDVEQPPPEQLAGGERARTQRSAHRWRRGRRRRGRRPSAAPSTAGTSAAPGAPHRATAARRGATGATSWRPWRRGRRPARRRRARRARSAPGRGRRRWRRSARSSAACATPAGRARRRAGPRRRRRARRRRRRAPASAGTPTAPTASAAYSESRATSRLSHDRRRLRNAFQAAIGRPRWKIAPAIPDAASTAASSRSPAEPAVALTPRASWLSNVSHTSGQCGCSGRRFQSLAAYVSAGTSRGSSMRVVDSVSSTLGSCGASPAEWSARHSATFDLLDGDGVRRAGADARRREPLGEPRLAHVALGDDAPVGLERGDRVRAVPRAVLAADAVVGVVGDDAVVQLDVGVRRAALEAGRLEAVVARHRQVEAAGVRVVAALDLTDTPPRRAGRQPVLLGARHLAGVAADAGVHGEAEAVLLAGVERQQLGPAVGDDGVVRRPGARRLHRQRDRATSTGHPTATAAACPAVTHRDRTWTTPSITWASWTRDGHVGVEAAPGAPGRSAACTAARRPSPPRRRRRRGPG